MVDVLPGTVWRERERLHQERVDAATAGQRARREDGRTHPVEDFLFSYYRHKPAMLRRWHPGVGVALADVGVEPRADWKFMRRNGTRVELDGSQFLAERGATVVFVRDLLVRTLGRAPHLGCFGMHEWAMVYGQTPDQLRHAGWPLRLGQAATDAVVESRPLTCSHFDAFRFFTPPARRLNAAVLQRDSQIDHEQPGCLHAGMDVYKWAFKLTPAVPSELVMDCFDLAREIRELDMRAAPYDLSELGYEPVPIETAAGRAEYVAAQRAFAERSQALRRRLILVCDLILEDADAGPRRGVEGFERETGDLSV